VTLLTIRLTGKVRATARLTNERHDPPGDQVPVVIQHEWHDRLNVHHHARRVLIADALLPIELERHGDEIGNGILKRLGELGRIAARLSPSAELKQQR